MAEINGPLDVPRRQDEKQTWPRITKALPSQQVDVNLLTLRLTPLADASKQLALDTCPLDGVIYVTFFIAGADHSVVSENCKHQP